PYLKSLPVSQCVRHRQGARGATHWRSFATSLRQHLASISRHGWRRFLGPALRHQLCRAKKEVCTENAGYCPLGCLVAHLVLLLSAPRAYRLDAQLFSPTALHTWEKLGVGLGYFLWNPTGFKLADLLYSGWPLFALLREMRLPLARLAKLSTGETHADEYFHILKLRRSAVATGSRQSVTEWMARIICIYKPAWMQDTSCPTLEAETALEKAEELLRKAGHASKSALLGFEAQLAVAEQALKRLLRWFQPLPGEFQAPAARLAAGLLIAGDVALPRLERLQRLLQKMEVRWPTSEERLFPAQDLPEQFALLAEAAYVQRLFDQLTRPVLTFHDTRPEAPHEAWLVFLWGGRDAKAEARAWVHGEAIRTLAHSVRKAEAVQGSLVRQLKANDWTHAGATPLSELDCNATYSGTVTNVGQFGVFVDFGAVKDALLKVPTKLGRRLRKGMELEGLAILSLDPDAGKVVMEADEEQLSELEPRKAPARARSASRPRKKRTNWDHEGATPLEELRVGDICEGQVTNVSVYGVFVDIGATRDARLNVPAAIGRRFRIGDEVQDCTIDMIDLEQQRMSAMLPDPEEAVRHLPPKERQPKEPKEPKPQPKEPKPKSQPAQATAK
ncbi:unnamed protein product, partial [Effrenium voratum]